MAEVQMATVVFTDLVGSTELASRLDPDVADELRTTHFALLRQAIATHGGTEVKNLGDGLMVVFSTTSQALNCAEAMQQAIDRHNRTAAEALRIRVGLSHGDVTEEDGDYFGEAVVEAARLCAKAEGGQILAAQVVHLAAGRRATQRTIFVGELELKGLPDPVATVEVCWAPADVSDDEGLVPLPARCATTTVGGFVGRVTEQTALSDAFKQANTDDRHRVVLIGGEPGVGKTTLAAEWARSAHRDGAIVLYGRADEDLGVPYQPWAEALTHLVAYAPEAFLESLAAHRPSLVRLAPALAAALGTQDTPAIADPEAARYILFGAVIATLAATAQLAPAVVVLDDLQWADAPSLQLLRQVATTTSPMRLVVIGTFRESDVGRSHPLADLLAALHREPVTERIALRGLNDVELLALMEGAAGQRLEQDGLALRDALLAETDGNPFFVGELLRHLVETGSIYQHDDRWVASTDLQERGLPVSVKEVIGRRVARIGDEGARVLAIASVIGRDFDLGLLAAVAETDESAVLDLLDAAVEATLVSTVAGERYSFEHALVEHTLYDSLAPARLGRLHRKVADTIEARSAGQTEGHAAQLAYHYAHATPQDLTKATSYARSAGDAALAQLAPDEALRWYAQALSQLHQGHRDDELRCALLVGLGDAQRQTGDPAYRETLLDAAHLAQDLHARDLLVAAALANNRGMSSTIGLVDAERVAVLQAACAAIEDTESAEHARLLALLASELAYGGDLAGRTEVAYRSLNMARALGDPATLAGVINDAISAFNIPETLAESLSLSAEALDAARCAGDPALEFWSAFCLARAQYMAGQVIEGDNTLSAMRRAVDLLGQPMLRWTLATGEAARVLLAGDVEEAEHLAVQAAEMGSATGQPDAAVFFAAQIGYIRMMQGRAAEIIDLVRQTVVNNPGIPGFATLLAHLCCDVDRPDEARDVLGPWVSDGFASVPKDILWLTTTAHAAYAIAELGWLEAATTLQELLRPFADQLIHPNAVSLGQVNYYVGILDSTRGCFDAAEGCFSEAAATHQRVGAAWALAMTQLGWARLLMTRGSAADLDRATALLDQALRSARERGYGLVEKRAVQSLEALRER